MYSAPIENEEKLHLRIFNACQTIRKWAGPLKLHDIAWSDVFMRALIQAEDVWKFIMNCDSTSSIKLKVIKLEHIL
jgi:hypothetical protein